MPNMRTKYSTPQSTREVASMPVNSTARQARCSPTNGPQRTQLGSFEERRVRGDFRPRWAVEARIVLIGRSLIPGELRGTTPTGPLLRGAGGRPVRRERGRVGRARG